MDKRKKITPSIIFWILVAIAALFLRTFLIYYSFWHHHYLVPPGNDVVTHYQIIQNILAGGKLSFLNYPPGFHLLVIFFSKSFHLNVWTILTSWTPILMILPSLAIFFLLRQLFSLRTSVISSAVLLLTSAYPVLAFADGNYPDILAYGVFGVLLFVFLIRYLKTEKYSNLIWAAVFLLLIAFTHHLTFFSIFGILVLFGLLEFYRKLYFSERKLSLKIFLGLAVFLFVSGISLLLANFLYGGVAFRFIEGLFQNQSFVHNVYFSSAPNFGDYPATTGGLVWYFGIAGFIYVVATKFSQKEDGRIKSLLIIWLLFFFLLSRLSLSGLPSRFARELALPLVVFLGYFLDFLFNNLTVHRFGKLLAYGLTGYLILINSALYVGLGKIPDGFADQIWFWPVDQQKIDYLATQFSNKKVLYNPSANPFFIIKSENPLIPLKLSSEERKTVQSYLDFPKNKNYQNAFDQLVDSFKAKYNEDLIFDDVKPPGNTGGVYPVYANYEVNKAVLEELASSGKEVKVFDDSAAVYEMK